MDHRVSSWRASPDVEIEVHQGWFEAGDSKTRGEQLHTFSKNFDETRGTSVLINTQALYSYVLQCNGLEDLFSLSLDRVTIPVPEPAKTPHPELGRSLHREPGFGSQPQDSSLDPLHQKKLTCVKILWALCGYPSVVAHPQ